MLELELMNIWSTKSWLGLHAIKGCDALLLSGLPRNALQHGYLLNGIFSIAAIDMARQATSDKNVKMYTRAALEYGNQASTQFRTALTTATSADIHLLYYFATLASVLNFSMPSRYPNALDGLDISFNLFLGSFRIAGTDLDWLMRSPCSLAIAAQQLPVSPALKDQLDFETTVAIARMTSVSEAVHVSSQMPGELGGFASEVMPYPVTIAQTQDCFAQELDDPVKGFFLTVVAVGGREFAWAVQQREPVALFIIMPPLSSRPGPLALISSWLAYQPQPIPIINKTLPSNGTSLLILSFLGLNGFYQFYNAPLAGNLIFAFADRAGCMFVVNLPLLYLLAAKNQPLKHLTGQSYEALNIFHRRVGELLCLYAAVHFGGMLAFQCFKPEWLMRGTFWEFLQHRLVLLGIGAFVSYELLYLSSLGSFRQRWYELFLASHVILQITALAFLWLHYHTARPFVTAALIIFSVDRLVWRLVVKQTTMSAELTVLPDGDTIMLSTNWDLASVSRLQGGIMAGWKPTDHVFLTVPALGRTHALQAHPFTIASAAPSSAGIDGDDGHGGGATTHAWLNLLIRAHTGFTRDLLHYAHRHRSVVVRLDGPYGSSHALDTLRAADDVILVAGGSGIAVAFPLAWALLREQQQQRRQTAAVRGSAGTLEAASESKDIARRVRLLWIIHSEEHRYWVPGALLDDLVAAGLDLVIPSPTATAGRPDVQGHVQGWIGQAEVEERNTRVLVSGPDGLNRVVRNSCSRALRRGADVRIVVEKFGW
ncbi:hypothetical protein ACHAQA_008471 [Verticillium albo-atrum]